MTTTDVNQHHDLDDFTVDTATVDDWRQITAWGNQEGWNIGFHDAECFFAADPGGFFIGRVGGRPVSAVSMVNYSDEFSAWGHYLVDPRLRGRGYGQGVWEVAVRHAGSRAASGDAMPGVVGFYRREGMVPVHHTVHWAGRLARAGREVDGVEPVRPEQLGAVADYDGECFPAHRPGFLGRWLFAPGHVARAHWAGGRVTGYGVLRPAPTGYRIGPLVADTPRIAAEVFDALTAHLRPGAEVSAFSPEVQEAAAPLLSAGGLAERFRLVRVHRGAPPAHRARNVYAIASLELG